MLGFASVLVQERPVGVFLPVRELVPGIDPIDAQRGGPSGWSASPWSARFGAGHALAPKFRQVQLWRKGPGLSTSWTS